MTLPSSVSASQDRPLDASPYNSGDPCDGGVPCVGGFCADAGWCVVDQDLGAITDCNVDRHRPNTCAQGACCPDAGIEGIPDGGGWCCGLVDGGSPTSLPCFGRGLLRNLQLLRGG